MIHPSYKEMIEKINDTAVEGDLTITNRYSLVLATAKRARQINAGSEPLVDARPKEKNLSVAVKEFYAGYVHVLDPEAEAEYAEDDGEYYGDDLESEEALPEAEDGDEAPAVDAEDEVEAAESVEE